MVTPSEKLGRSLGTLMVIGSLIGVFLAFTSVAALVLLGQDVEQWQLSLRGWWHGDHAALRFLAGVGILMLAATPVAMLAVFGVQAVREKQWKTVFAAGGLLLIMACGLAQGLLGWLVF